MGPMHKHKVTQIHVDYNQAQQNKNEYRYIKKQKLIRRLMAIGLCAAFLSVLVITTLVNRVATVKEKEAEQAQLEAEYANLKAKEVNLKDEMKKLNNDDYIAKIARNEYFLSEKGEVIFKVSE